MSQIPRPADPVLKVGGQARCQGSNGARLITDTTQIKASGSSISATLRNLILLIDASAMVVVRSPRLFAFCLGSDPGHGAAALVAMR